MITQNSVVGPTKPRNIKSLIIKIILLFLGLVFGGIVVLVFFVYYFLLWASNEKSNRVKIFEKNYESSIVFPSSYKFKSVTDNADLVMVQLAADYTYDTSGTRGDVYNQLKQLFVSSGYSISESTDTTATTEANPYMVDDNFQAINGKKHIRVFVYPMPHSTNFYSNSVQKTLDEQVSYVIISVQEY